MNTPTNSPTNGRQRLGRLGPAMASVVTVLALATGCTPASPISGFTGPNGAAARPWTLNESGIAVGSLVANGGFRAFLMDVGTGQQSVLPPIPVQAGFPAGGTFADARDINDVGDLAVGNANDASAPSTNGAGDVAVAIDLDDGSVTRLDCPAFRDIGWGLVTDNGLVVCGDVILHIHSGLRESVAMPVGCDGVVAKVTDSGLAVGYCTAGTAPLFVTDRSTGETATFGTELGIAPVPSPDAFLGTLTETGYLIGTKPQGGVFVYTLQGAVATPVDIGPLDGQPTTGYAIDADGVATVGAELPDAAGWSVFSYNVATGKLRGHPSELDPAKIAIPTGRNTKGQFVGFIVQPESDVAYGAFSSSG